ncbi:hypothetical protein LTR66_002851 [Elasticomyces elasticus]|nr:hypothetical protein LTR66_002851 [Elasticomyces elasticus]
MTPVRVPAWKRIGLKLKNDRGTTETTSGGFDELHTNRQASLPLRDKEASEQTQLAGSEDSIKAPRVKNSKRLRPETKEDGISKRRKRSFEDEREAPVVARHEHSTTKHTPSSLKSAIHMKANVDKGAPPDALRPPAAELNPAVPRRKSVAFTPETKCEDGNSAQEMFHSWVAEQKSDGQFADFSAEEIAEFSGPLAAHLAMESKGVLESNNTRKDHKKGERKEKAPKSESNDATSQAGKSAKERRPKIKPQGIPEYLSYLRLYHSDQAKWKFNKSKQIKLLKNTFNLYRIPSEYDEALEAYILGLQGVETRALVREAAQRVLDEAGARDQAEKQGEQDEELRVPLGRCKRAEMVLDALRNVPASRAPLSYSGPASTHVVGPPDPNQNGGSTTANPADITRHAGDNAKGPRRKRKLRTAAANDTTSSSSSGSDGSDSSAASDSDEEDTKNSPKTLSAKDEKLQSGRRNRTASNGSDTSSETSDGSSYSSDSSN